MSEIKNTELVINPQGGAPATEIPERSSTAVGRVRKGLTHPVASLVALVIGLLWTIPTAGLLVQSFRPKTAQDTSGWWTAFAHPGNFTLDFYRQLTVGLHGDSTGSLLPYMANSLAIVIPAAIIPMAVAAMAAYALVWIDFPGRDWIFVGIFALQVVPLQVAAVPVLRFVVSGWHLGSTTIIPSMGLSGTVGAIWLAHACFALPLAVFLMHNFMSEVPKDLLEAARIDGANHGQIFRQVMLPLLKPVLAAFGIFQFLWVWNDLFVGSVMSGGNPNISPITVKISNLIGATSGAGGERVPAAGFLSIIIPLIVFMSLQRYFVRGLLAGSVKG
ncbi:carbohydrate ABC transporter permease [Jatrophihabitans telluris]|uniref:Carbohydrate ABC transporter permease n=1 Tax=Jatrophihabitans telluris TaxID=2038343 RepID=A0ABY4R314_9ACTN|nr:carbohydrate ABC transporter permease [Jatrophihabitans telluris]UQX89857.1 carbohydrate ABC transporter permease [Jatrophihabitans telluris]